MLTKNKNNITIISKVKLNNIIKRFYPGGMVIPNAVILNPLFKANNYQKISSVITSMIPIRDLKNHQYLTRKYFYENRSSFSVIKVNRNGIAIISPLSSTQEMNASLGIKKPVNVIPKKMKSNSGKEFETTINLSTIEDDITDQDLITELKKRELIKHDDGKNRLIDKWKKMTKLGVHFLFDKDGLTKEDCLKMCQEHDKIVLNKGKHPLTLDQIKLNEENEKKQQELKEKIIKYDPNFN